MDKLALKIKIYSTTPYKPESMSPVIFDRDKANLWINPNGGSARHWQIYETMSDKGLDYPESEFHGYYYPNGDNYDARYDTGSGANTDYFRWYPHHGLPTQVESGQILTALQVLTQDWKTR
jgi:hypothetical protein